MLSYVIGFIAFLVVFSNPISEFLYPGSTGRRDAAYSRPQLNESLLAIDVPNATVPVCEADSYVARILHREPLVVYLEGFLSEEERKHLLEIR